MVYFLLYICYFIPCKILAYFILMFLLLDMFNCSDIALLVRNWLTCKIFLFQVGFAAADAVTGLKLIEAGVKKETLALLAVPLVPLQILLPLVIARFTTGETNFEFYD